MTRKKKSHLDATGPGRTYMLPAETIRMGVLLQTHCKPIKNEAGEDTKLWRYAKGWDDQRVATETGERLNTMHVMRLRRSLDMKLEPIPKGPKGKGIGSQTYKLKFNEIDRRFRELELHIAESIGTLRNMMHTEEQVTSISNRMQELVLKNSVLESVNEELVRTVHDLTHRFVQIEMTLSTLQLGNLEK